MKVNVLGTEYSISIDDFGSPGLGDEQASGYCCFDSKEIHIEDFETDDEWRNESDAVKKNRKCITLRHEIIHAFLLESGLNQNSLKADAWANNEEMVEWMAIQAPKIMQAFREAGCT